MSPLRWTVKSTRALARELTRAGHRVSADTVADLLREEGFSLQANAKTLEGSHVDRDQQFRYQQTWPWPFYERRIDSTANASVS